MISIFYKYFILVLFFAFILKTNCNAQCIYINFDGDTAKCTTANYDTISMFKYDMDSIIIQDNNFDSLSSWKDTFEINQTDTNYYVTASSDFDTVACADDWLIFGPVNFLSCFSGHVEWRHRVKDDSSRNGYEVLLLDNIDSLHSSIIDTIFHIPDQSTQIDTNWTSNWISLWSVQPGYIAFHHSSCQKKSLDIDDVWISCIGCGKLEKYYKVKTQAVYPNPCKNKLTVEYSLPLKNENSTIFICDIKGNIVLQINNIEKGVKSSAFQNREIDIKTLPSGVYNYYIESGNKLSEKQKFVKIN